VTSILSAMRSQACFRGRRLLLAVTDERISSPVFSIVVCG